MEINIESMREELSADAAMDVCGLCEEKEDFEMLFRGTGTFHDQYTGGIDQGEGGRGCAQRA